MKIKILLVAAVIFLYARFISAQTTGTFIVADKGNSMYSCEDTLITFEQIFNKTGIRDLNDANDNISKYKMFRLDGIIVTNDEITAPFKYSTYDRVHIQKTGADPILNSAVVIDFSIITPPTSLFAVDTLNYIVDKGEKVNFANDFFTNVKFWSSGNNILDLNHRLTFTDLSTGIQTPMTEDFESIVGKGKYKIRQQVSVCSPYDYYYDSMYVIVEESPCHSIAIKNVPSVCREDIIDIRPYVFVDGIAATPAQLEDMIYWNRSNIFDQESGLPMNPASMDMKDMFNKTDLFPYVEMGYQPNIDMNICENYFYTFNLKVPSKIPKTESVFAKTNYDEEEIFKITGTYYGFNNQFNTDILKKLYLDNYTIFEGTAFNYFRDQTYTLPVSGTVIEPGTYYVVAVNEMCGNDSSGFVVTIQNKDFDIQWKAAESLGKGYYIFTAPVYSGATYNWSAWGGFIVSGRNTNEVIVYYSEQAASTVTTSCVITLANARTAGNGGMSSAVYITTNDNSREEITLDARLPDVSLNKNVSFAYPNPAAGTFAVTGNGKYEIMVYNNIGKLVYANDAYEANDPIAITGKGMYSVCITQEGIKQSLKVIIE